MSIYNNRYCIWKPGNVIHYTSSFHKMLHALDMGWPVAEGCEGYNESTGSFFHIIRPLDRIPQMANKFS